MTDKVYIVGKRKFVVCVECNTVHFWDRVEKEGCPHCKSKGFYELE